jgi:hypothetical protein
MESIALEPSCRAKLASSMLDTLVKDRVQDKNVRGGVSRRLKRTAEKIRTDEDHVIRAPSLMQGNLASSCVKNSAVEKS